MESKLAVGSMADSNQLNFNGIRSSTSTSLLFHAAAVDPRSEAGLVAQHHMRGRRFAYAVRQVAQRPRGFGTGAFAAHRSQHPRSRGHSRVGQLHLRRFQQAGPSGKHHFCQSRR